MDWRYTLSDITFGPEEKEAVQQVLDSRWLTMGEVTQAFEAEFAAMLGVRHAIAVSNGTTALHLACIAAGLGPGDEAIVPSLTFVATANAVRYTGAAPVFADIRSLQDLTISPEAIREKVTGRTRAIVVMHYGGYACNMPAIMDIAAEFGLQVIEDAAHAPGSELLGRKLGTWGIAGCFSFFSNKNLVTGEGGMVVTNSDAVAERIRLLRSHGMTSLTLDRHKGHAWSYDVVALGYNYRLDEIRAALGRVQLSRLEENNLSRRELTGLYRELLQAYVPQVEIPFLNHPGVSACHLMPVLLPEALPREQFMNKMKDRGIQTSIHYPPIHQFTAFQSGELSDGSLALTEQAALREVTLPLYPALSLADIEVIVTEVQASLAGIPAGRISPA